MKSSSLAPWSWAFGPQNHNNFLLLKLRMLWNSVMATEAD